MKRLRQIFTVVVLSFTIPVIAQQQDEQLYFSIQSGKPVLYAVSTRLQVIAQPLQGVKAWDLQAGKEVSPHPADLPRVTAAFFDNFSWSKMVRDGNKSLFRICMMGDSMLVNDDKGKVSIAAPQNGKYKQGDKIDVLTEARNDEEKEQRAFITSYQPIQKQLYFLRKGTLCRWSMSKPETIEEIIKPVGGLQAVSFTMLPSGTHALLRFVPSSMKWTRWSSAYNDEAYRIFNLTTGRPVSIPIRNGITTMFSADGKQVLTASFLNTNGLGHEGSLYDVATDNEVRHYGSAIVQRTKEWIWNSYVHTRFLYTVSRLPSFGPPTRTVKVYDLLDSLRPVKSFSIPASDTFPTIPAGFAGAPFPPSATVMEIIKALPPLTLPLSITSFNRPVPGRQIPPSLWRTFGFTLDYYNTGIVTRPRPSDSAAGNYKVYAIGSLSSSAAGQARLFATHLFIDQNKAIAENERVSYLQYWLCVYDSKTQKFSIPRQLVSDDKPYVTELENYTFPKATIQRADGKLHFSGSNGVRIIFDPETLEIK